MLVNTDIARFHISFNDTLARVIKNVSNDPEKMMLKFYSAFGGINGSIGAKYEFDLPLSPECKEIYVLLYDDYKLLIAKNPTTGEWEMV